MNDLVDVARKVMTWHLAVGLLCAVLAFLQYGQASSLARTLLDLSTHANKAPKSIEDLRGHADIESVRSLELRWILSIKPEDIHGELFMTSIRPQPEGLQPAGQHPRFPDERRSHDFRVALARFQELSLPYEGLLQTVGELDEAVAPYSELPFAKVSVSPGRALMYLAIVLLAQLLYLSSIFSTMKAVSNSDSGALDSWVFFHKGWLAKPLGFLWILSPSALLLFASIRYGGFKDFDTLPSILGFALCCVALVVAAIAWWQATGVRR